MIETNIEEIERMAYEWQAQGLKWHFHMLTPDCAYNTRKDKQAFVLENLSSALVYVAYSDERYMKSGKKLVQLLHGENIVEEAQGELKASCAAAARMLERARELNSKATHWHHHMLFPECVLNKHPGSWAIVFEDPERDSVLEALYDAEPVNDLRLIEVEFYSQNA